MEISRWFQDRPPQVENPACSEIVLIYIKSVNIGGSMRRIDD